MIFFKEWNSKIRRYFYELNLNTQYCEEAFFISPGVQTDLVGATFFIFSCLFDIHNLVRNCNTTRSQSQWATSKHSVLPKVLLGSCSWKISIFSSSLIIRLNSMPCCQHEHIILWSISLPVSNCRYLISAVCFFGVWIVIVQLHIIQCFLIRRICFLK